MAGGTREQKRVLYEQMIGSVLADKFTITALLGFGGMGAVYEAVQAPMDRKVALKLIPTYDPTAAARFEREAYTVSKLTHPNTVTVFDFGHTDDGHLYLSMEHLIGTTLTELIQTRGPLPPHQAVHIAQQMCRSLGEAHRQGIIHRDVKPDNIFLIEVDGDSNYVKVLDFGIAKAVHGEDDVNLTAEGRIIGTPRYMSPEQILAQPVDHRSDIYSLGCILFEMLCGSPPFDQQSTAALMMSHAQQAPPTFADRLTPQQVQAVPPGLESLVRRTMAKNPNSRPQTTDDLRHELERALRINQAYEGNTGETQQVARNHRHPGSVGPPRAFNTGSHSGQSNTGNHPGGNTGNHYGARPFNPTGQNAASESGVSNQTGGFDHHTGDYSRQTGDFPTQQKQQQQAHEQQARASDHVGEPTNSELALELAQMKGKQKRNTIIAIIVIAILAIGAYVAFTMSQTKSSDKPNTDTNTIAANAVEKKDTAPPVEEKKARTETMLVSSPAGATVYLDVDGAPKKLGKTPHKLTFSKGDTIKTYRFELEGYSPNAVTVDPNNLEATYTRALEPAPKEDKKSSKTSRRKTSRKKSTTKKKADPPEETTPAVTTEVKETTPAEKPRETTPAVIVPKLDDNDSIEVKKLDD